MGEGEDNVKDAPVTHLALQKLLYFVQSWSRTLLDQAMFDDDCEAWVHGAVYPNVYSVFRQFKYAPLPSVEESFEFGEQEQRILNAVKKYYFDIYSAKALEEICHREPPYIETREGFPEGKACHKVMDAEKISSYYGKVVQKYKIRLSDMSNIKVYLSIILSY
nr:type II toxin-antitoxin system antitoxin SocA domain-containing protein [uncultured Acetatifactor sp.]